MRSIIVLNSYPRLVNRLKNNNKRIINYIEGLLAALKAHNQPVDNMPPFRDEIISKYPLWLAWAARKGEIPSITVFQKVIATKILLSKNLYAASSVTRTAAKYKADQSSSAFPLVAVASISEMDKSRPNGKGNKKDRNKLSCIFYS